MTSRRSSERAAERLSWPDGWRLRYLECSAQRGLKVIGTFLRLAAAGRPAYLAWLPVVRARALEALESLGAPGPLCTAVGASAVEGL
jgi:aminoglycoside/choline kinase family phosphotransferase